MVSTNYFTFMLKSTIILRTVYQYLLFRTDGGRHCQRNKWFEMVSSIFSVRIYHRKETFCSSRALLRGPVPFLMHKNLGIKLRTIIIQIPCEGNWQCNFEFKAVNTEIKCETKKKVPITQLSESSKFCKNFPSALKNTWRAT